MIWAGVIWGGVIWGGVIWGGVIWGGGVVQGRAQVGDLGADVGRAGAVEDPAHQSTGRPFRWLRLRARLATAHPRASSRSPAGPVVAMTLIT